MKEELSELDNFSTAIKLHLKDMIIPKLSNAKFGLVKVTETANIEAYFHLHCCSAKELFLKICLNYQTPAQSLFFKGCVRYF